jgi:hypothetical protein
VGRKAARLSSGEKQSPQKLFPYLKESFGAPSKNVSIFAGFVRRQTTSRWAGLPLFGRQSVGVLPKMSSNFFNKHHQ